MRIRRLGVSASVFIAAVDVAGLGAFALLWWTGPRPEPSWQLAAALACTILSAPFRVQLPVFGNVSIAFTFVFATLLLFGAPAAALAGAAAGLSASLLRVCRRPPWRRIVFNVAELSLSGAAAGVVFGLAGGTPGTLEPAREWAACLAATGAFFLVNTWTVSIAISLTEGLPLLLNWGRNFLWTVPAYVAGTFLGATLILGVHSFGIWALFLSLPLLYVLYFSLRIYLDKLRQEQQHGAQMANLYLKVIEALALAIDAKDRTTQRHVRRVQTFAVELGRTLGLPPSDLEALKAGSLLHDIGKLAVPEHILCKPGKLTRDEYEKMRIHPRIGAEILETVDFPFPLTTVVRSHHEKWDGTGYPDRLKGEEIPLAARILAVCDCFDALTSDRPYRRPLTKEQALAYIKEESGVSYDPRVVDALVQNLDRLEALAAEVNRLPPETASAPDKRQITRATDPTKRDENALRTSIMDHISSAHQELYALYEIAQSSARSLNLDEAMGFISSKIARVLHYRCLVLYLAEKDGTLKARYVNGRDASRLLGRTIKVGERMSGWAAMHRMPICGAADDHPVERAGMRSDLEELLAREEIEPLKNALVAPLIEGDTFLGVLALYDRPKRPYVEDDLRLISTIAKHVTTAVRNALTYGAARETALTDPLTRLPNARYLFVSFEEELSRCLRQQVPLSIIEIDVNGFKEINDQHGHPAGDRILRSLARAVRAQLRGCDTCVRYAADEFIVIVPGIGKAEVARMQGRIQQAIETHKFAVHGGRSVHLSISSGSASFPEDGRTFDALIAVADARLYDAKSARSGRPPDKEGYQRFTGRRGVPVN